MERDEPPPEPSEARARYDSRLQATDSTALNETADATEGSRYLSYSSSSKQTFDQAFAHIRQTSSFKNPPPIAPPPSEPTAKPQQPPPSSRTRDTSILVYVNRCQTGNPLLKAIKNVGVEFRDGLVPDYVMEHADGTNTCVLFLSVRYHLLHGHYLEERINRVKKEDPTPYRVRVVLVLVDVEDNEVALREINRLALLSQFTLILSWSWSEAARYLETLKAYENKSASLIKEKVEAEFLPKANEVLTSIRSVNKTDVVTLLSTFGTIRGVMNASVEELSLCPGVGEKKVRQLLRAFQEPFVKQ